MTLAMMANASRRQIRLLDVALSIWLAVWLAIGILIGIDVHNLGHLSATLSDSGKALQQVAKALQGLSAIPLVGHQLGALASQLARTGRSAQLNATQTRQSIDQLSYLLAIVVVIIPGMPVLGLYLPFRLGRAREARTVRQAMASTTNRRLLERYLANRALYNLPYHQLEGISEEPWEDVNRGHLADLAEAELCRLGFGQRERDRFRSGLP